jgi:nucleoside-diphosphate-sugar epimerase
VPDAIRWYIEVSIEIVDGRGQPDTAGSKLMTLFGSYYRLCFADSGLDVDALYKACRGVDYVLHQAAIPSVPRSVQDPLGNNRANVDGTLNLLVAARDAKVKRVIYAASSSAYGDTPTLPKREDIAAQPDFSLRRRQTRGRILYDQLLPLLRPGGSEPALF